MWWPGLQEDGFHLLLEYSRGQFLRLQCRKWYICSCSSILGVFSLWFCVWVKGHRCLTSPTGDVERWYWSGQKERSVNDSVCNHLREKKSPSSPFSSFTDALCTVSKDWLGITPSSLQPGWSLDVRLFEGGKKSKKKLMVFCEWLPKNCCKFLCFLKQFSS